MRKDNPFHTLAEALEAGEPPLMDKITGERDAQFFIAGDVEKYKVLEIKRVFCTATGGFVILAWPPATEEKARSVIE